MDYTEETNTEELDHNLWWLVPRVSDQSKHSGSKCCFQAVPALCSFEVFSAE